MGGCRDSSVFRSPVARDEAGTLLDNIEAGPWRRQFGANLNPASRLPAGVPS